MPRKKRQKQRQVQLTGRDYCVLAALHRYQVLSTDQIYRLIFQKPLDPVLSEQRRREAIARIQAQGAEVKQIGAARINVCRDRLSVLKDNCLINRDRQPDKSGQGRRVAGYIYWLDEGGREVLAQRLGMDVEDMEAVSDSRGPQLNHRLLSNELQLSIELGAERLGLVIHRYRNEVELQRDHSHDRIVAEFLDGSIHEEAVLVPDGYVYLEGSGGQEFHWFLENDLATMTLRFSEQLPGQRDITGKVRGYNAYYNSGLYHDRYTTNSLQVLFVTTTDVRAQHMRQIIRECGGRERFWVSSWEALDAHDLRERPEVFLMAPLWQKAALQAESAQDDPDAYLSLLSAEYL